MAPCIACHSEQYGGYHSQLKESRDYQGFMGNMVGSSDSAATIEDISQRVLKRFMGYAVVL
ncbi:hypothetical protein F4009_21180 [Candidatus Poribacteria bacterium]|nr:hypothetical protein [Candidatus Poribacteria bacterium]MYH82724.1 hypothetical protein [Candidatus Poribacteria bacterium]MYK96476.1 hypothetical protein [Candidatus Poribacteria bacterium]